MIAKPSFKGYLKAVKNNERDRLQREFGSSYVMDKTSWREKSAMGETSGQLGGYLLPPIFTERFFRSLAEQSILWQRCAIHKMDSVEALAPVVDFQTQQTAAASGAPVASPLHGGLTMSFGFNPVKQNPTPSTAPPQATTLTMRQVSLYAWDLLGFVTTTGQFADDLSDAGEQALFDLFASATAWSAEWAFINGTGAAGQMPIGILNGPATLTVSRAVGNQIAQADVSAMVSKLLPYAFTDAIWMCSPSALAQITQMAGYFANAPATPEPGAFCGLLHTRPLFCSDKLPSLGTTGDLILFSPSLYIIGDRQQVAIESSRENPGVFTSNLCDFRAWARVDGRPMLSGSIKLPNGDTVSGYVVLHA